MQGFHQQRRRKIGRLALANGAVGEAVWLSGSRRQGPQTGIKR